MLNYTKAISAISSTSNLHKQRDAHALKIVNKIDISFEEVFHQWHVSCDLGKTEIWYFNADKMPSITHEKCFTSARGFPLNYWGQTNCDTIFLCLEEENLDKFSAFLILS